MSARPKVLVFNQYYWPGVEATAHLLTHLCEDLTDEFDVTVVTGRLRSVAERAERLSRNGVTIIRVPSTAFDRALLPMRGVNYASFLASSFWAGLRVPRPDVVLSLTDPPIVADIALAVARRFGVPLAVVTQDVFPEAAVQLGRLEQPLAIEVLTRMIRFALERADLVVAIGETMRMRLEAKGVAPDRIAVIPNWADTDEITPKPRQNEWSFEHGLADRFVVMHSGNVGYAADLDSLVYASTLMRDIDDLAVVVIGAGARRAVLQQLAERIESDAVRFYPYQPSGVVSLSLSSADVHFVGLAQGLAGYVVPSRVYGIMAAARPMIVSAEAESETARLVNQVGCGIVVEPGRTDLVAGAIREMLTRRDELDEMGRRGHEYVRANASRPIAVGRYRTVLGELARRRG